MRNCLIALVLGVAATAGAQAKRPPPISPPKNPPVIDIGPMQVVGKLRVAMLLEFLERAGEELERATLPQRSFVPELVRSMESEDL